MQLIQIGEVRQKTVLELVQQMASSQHAEIEELKTIARNRTKSRRSHPQPPALQPPRDKSVRPDYFSLFGITAYVGLW